VEICEVLWCVVRMRVPTWRPDWGFLCASRLGVPNWRPELASRMASRLGGSRNEGFQRVPNELFIKVWFRGGGVGCGCVCASRLGVPTGGGCILEGFQCVPTGGVYMGGTPMRVPTEPLCQQGDSRRKARVGYRCFWVFLDGWNRWNSMEWGI